MSKPHVVSSARDFAVRAGPPKGREPDAYALHLDEVAVLVQEFGDVHQTVAYLHEALDNEEATAAQVEAEFGPLVAGCVNALATPLSEDPKEGSRLRYAKLVEVSAQDDRVIALVVAAADRLACIQDCYLSEDRGGLRRYRRDHRDFRAAVFRPGIAEDLWRELAALATTG